ncbi:hypothetical protein [Geodermatophilus sp. URMC 64]
MAAVIFGAIGVFTFWVGLLDFLSAANLQYKLIGFAFAVAGLVLLTGSAVLGREQWRRKRGRVAAVTAGIAGAFVGGYLLLMQYRAPGLSPSRLPPFPAWVPWAGIAVASVAGAVLGWMSTKGHADEQVWTAFGKPVFAGGLSVTVLLSGVQWWYTQQYQPNATPAALTVTTELRPAASASTAAGAEDMPNPHMFEGTITVKNVSDAKVQIVASLYLVTRITDALREGIEGINEVDQERQQVACFLEELAPVTDPECDDPGIFRYGQFSAGDPRGEDDYPISRTTTPGTFQTLQLGKIVDDMSWLEPEEEFEHNVLIHVPEEQGEPRAPDESPTLTSLELSAWFAVAQGSRLVLERIPSHGPEMVPQALMSNEEYRDYKEAARAAQLDAEPVQDSANSTATDADATEEVEIGRRQAYYEELTMSTSPRDAPLPVTGEPRRTPRPYPHRYSVVERPIEDLSTLHRLVWGSQAVDTVQVLSMRLYDPGNPSAPIDLTEVELADMVTCISPAGTLGDAAEDSEIRRDPTAVCPGFWYSLADDEGRLANDYERRYQEMADYRKDMADFYGLVETGSADVVSLTTEAEAEIAATTMPASPSVQPLPSEVFQQCKPALESAKQLTDYYKENIRSAFERHAAGMSGAPTLQDGADAAEVFDAYVERAISALLACSNSEAPEDSPAASCTKAAANDIDALRYARDLGQALQEAESTDAWLARGRDAVQAYQRAEDAVGPWLAACR